MDPVVGGILLAIAVIGAAVGVTLSLSIYNCYKDKDNDTWDI